MLRARCGRRAGRSGPAALRRRLLRVAAGLVLAGAYGGAASPAAAQEAPAGEGEAAGSASAPAVVLETSKGAIRIALLPERAPKTVENFLQYVDAGFYDGTVFHRVVPGFMIQGGGFTPGLEEKETRPPIANEAESSPPNERGTVAMARTQAADSATAQFFVNVADNDFLNAGERGAGYAVFGRVVEGMDVVDAIAQVDTTRKGRHSDVPVEPVVIESARRAKEGDGS